MMRRTQKTTTETTKNYDIAIRNLLRAASFAQQARDGGNKEACLKLVRELASSALTHMVRA